MPDGLPVKLAVDFTLNGKPVEVEVATNTVLGDLIRDHFGLQGVKLACSRAVCGACSVLVDGMPRASCSTFAFDVDGCDVRTVEGLEAEDGTLDSVQEAFADQSAFQCGYCTSGMILLTKALLDHDPDPDRETIVEWLSSNICRCTGYTLIIEAVQDAARRRRAAGAGSGR
jgi:carbon-monoxide dehydrogenase small subunit